MVAWLLYRLVLIPHLILYGGVCVVDSWGGLAGKQGWDIVCAGFGGDALFGGGLFGERFIA
jgi:hypothetical protein